MANARQKLNAASVNGSLILAMAIGFGTQSLVMGLVVFAVLIGLAAHSGDIRLHPTIKK